MLVRNGRQPTWKKLGKLADGNTPTGLIAYQLKRSEAAVYSKASDEKISLHPTNQSPYNRRKRLYADLFILQ